MIEYHSDKAMSHDDLSALYDSVGWSAYTKSVADLTQLIEGARHHLSAWDQGQLIGLVRVVDDGLYIAYIQDILVKPEYHRKGIGTELTKRMLDTLSYARQVILTTEDAPDTKAFYHSMGFASFTEGGALGFAKYNNG